MRYDCEVVDALSLKRMDEAIVALTQWAGRLKRLKKERGSMQDILKTGVLATSVKRMPLDVQDRVAVTNETLDQEHNLK